MKLSIPYNGEKKTLVKIFNSNLKSYIKDVYFAGNPLVLTSGRGPKIKNFVKKYGKNYYFDNIEFNKDIEQLVSLCAKYNIKCNLLLNFFGKLNFKQIKYVNELIEMGVEIITVGNLEMLSQINKKIRGSYRIQNSVYIEINNIKDIMNLIRNGVSILLIPPEKNHNLNYIYGLKTMLKNYNLEFKLLVNEGCLKGCKFRKFDQISVIQYTIDRTIDDCINNPEEINKVLNQPCRAYMNSYGIKDTNLIHPKNIYKYKHLDLTFKLAGRSFDARRILKAVQAYIDEIYSGDLRDIIENFKHSQKPIYYLENQKTHFLLERRQQ